MDLLPAGRGATRLSCLHWRGCMINHVSLYHSGQLLVTGLVELSWKLLLGKEQCTPSAQVRSGCGGALLFVGKEKQRPRKE